MRVFVDASAWVPMELPRDQWAPRVAVLLAELRRQPRLEFVTTNWTMYEALAIVRHRAPRSARQLHQTVTLLAQVIGVRIGDEREALRRFLDWADQGASVVDHANLLVAVRQRCDAILSFDSDFIPLGAAAGLEILR